MTNTTLKNAPFIWQAILTLTSYQGWEFNPELVEVVQELADIYEGKSGIEKRIRKKIKLGLTLEQIAANENMELTEASQIFTNIKAKMKGEAEKEVKAKAVVEFYKESYSLGEIAEKMGISISYVRDLLAKKGIKVGYSPSKRKRGVYK